MKSFFKSLLMVAGVVGSASHFVACQDNEIESLTPSVADEACVVQHITFQMPEFIYENEEAATRVSPEISDRGARFTWNQNDTIGVFPNSEYPYQIAFPISDDFAGTTNAAFDGGVWRLRENLTYSAYYPFNYYNADKNRIIVDMDGQRQVGNGTVGHLRNYVCLMSLPQDVDEEGKVNFNMKYLTSLVRIELTLPSKYDATNKTFNRLFLQSTGEEFINKGYVDVIDNENIIASKKTLQFSVELSSIQPSNGKLTIYAMMAPGNYSKTKFNVRLQGTDVLVGTMSGKDLVAGYAYMMSCSINPETKASVSYVDLGVPSGTLWASNNIGADKTYSAGSLFAWGETSPKSKFPFSSYSYGSGSNRFNKYVNNSEKYGESTWWLFRTFYFIDNKSVLESEDDAAIYNLGSDYRMPTVDEFNELITYCDWNYTTEQGVKGWKVSNRANRDAYIFLADGGNRESGTETAGYGYYWTTQLNTIDNTKAKCLLLDSKNKSCSIADASRHRGLLIRPVYIGSR